MFGVASTFEEKGKDYDVNHLKDEGIQGQRRTQEAEYQHGLLNVIGETAVYAELAKAVTENPGRLGAGNILPLYGVVKSKACYQNYARTAPAKWDYVAIGDYNWDTCEGTDIRGLVIERGRTRGSIKQRIPPPAKRPCGVNDERDFFHAFHRWVFLKKESKFFLFVSL